MSDRLRTLDDRTRAFFGGPGIAVLAVVTVFVLVVPGLAKMSGLDGFGTAVVMAAAAIVMVGAVRLWQRTRGDR